MAGTDEELARAAAAGDRAARSSLMEKVQPIIYRWVRDRIPDPDAADDVTQLVLLRVHLHLPTFRGESRFPSWLYRVTANEALGFLRRQATREKHERAWADQERIARPFHAPHNGLDGQRLERAIRALARSLPPAQKEAFERVDLGGLKPHEAADETGMNQSALRSSLCRARGKLRQLLLTSNPGLVRELRSEYHHPSPLSRGRSTAA